jgi:hypothetical protein
MSDYCIIINGVEWEYAPRDKGDPLPWTAPVRCRCQIPQHCERLTPTDLRAIADVMDRWAQDHQPQRRRRVVRIGAKYYARHELLPGWVYGWNQHQARECARTEKGCYPVMATDAAIDALLSLREQPDEEVPSDD